MKRLPEQVTIHEAKTHLSRLLVKVGRGQTIVIKKGNQPVAQLVPIKSQVETREFGTEKGLIKIANDFNSLPEDFIKHFKR